MADAPIPEGYFPKHEFGQPYMTVAQQWQLMRAKGIDDIHPASINSNTSGEVTPP